MADEDIADWSDADWRQWFSEEVDPDFISKLWRVFTKDREEIARELRRSGPHPQPAEGVIPPLEEDLQLIEAASALWDAYWGVGDPTGLTRSAVLDTFGRLSTEFKRNFYEGYRRQTGVADPPAGQIETPPEAEPETVDSSDEVIDLLSDEEGSELWSGSSEGPGINISLPGGKVVTVIGFGVVSVVLAGFVLFRGGDSEEAVSGEEGAVAESGQEVASQDEEAEPEPASSASLNVSFVDDQGDFVEREPFDPDPNPDSAADITLVSVRTEDDATIITLDFAAAGENHPGLGLNARITQSDGQIINMLRRPDGSAKVSEPPSGETLTAQWLDADTLELTLGNWTPNGDFELAVSTLISSKGLYTIDEWVGQLTP